MNDPQNSAALPVCHAETPAKGDPGTNIKALKASLASQETTFDEGGLRFYVTRREARIDVTFRTLDRANAANADDMDPMWLLTALLCDDGLRLIEQEMGSGEDAQQFFPSLEKHLAAHPALPLPEVLDTRFTQVSGLCLRVRRLNGGFAAPVRVDLRCRWKDGSPDSWMHAFDAELLPSMLGHAAALRVTDTSEVFVMSWGQAEHLARFAAYAALVSTVPCDVVTEQLPKVIAWGADESVFTKAVA